MDCDIVGIDLGTTNSCVAFLKEGVPSVVSINETTTVPSVLAIDGDRILIGRAALNRGRVAPADAIFSSKRYMGDPHKAWSIGGVAYTPQGVAEHTLRYLREQASIALGCDVRRAVVTVPAWFHESQRQATIAAGERAGLTIERIVNEPTAAALMYEWRGDDAAMGNEKWLVYDLGGGTFDVSVLDVSPSMKEVRASSGNVFLGGDDFDQTLVQLFMTKLKTTYDIDTEGDQYLRARLRFIAENTKCILSSVPVAQVHERIIVGDQSYDLELTVTRSEFTSLIAPMVESTMDKVSQVLDEARTTAADISRVLLVGGSTRIPMIAEELKRRFSFAPEGYVDADLSVALGAAMLAGEIAGVARGTVIVDVCPHTLGLAVLSAGDDMIMSLLELGNRSDDPEIHMTFAPIIRKNARLPARFTEQFYKLRPDQDRVIIPVYQGESEFLASNRRLGEIHAPFSSTAPELYITFEYDLNGTVRVGIQEGSIEAPTVWRMLGVPEDGFDIKAFDQNEEETAVTTPAQASVTNFLINKVRKRLADYAGPEKTEIEQCLVEYEGFLSAQNDDAIDDLESKLYKWLENQ